MRGGCLSDGLDIFVGRGRGIVIRWRCCRVLRRCRISAMYRAIFGDTWTYEEDCLDERTALP